MILFTWIFVLTLGILGKGATKKWLREDESKLARVIVIGYWISWTMATIGLGCKINWTEIKYSIIKANIHEDIQSISITLLGLALIITIMKLKRNKDGNNQN